MPSFLLFTEAARNTWPVVSPTGRRAAAASPAARLLTPGRLRVGIYDKLFWRRHGRSPDPSITYYQHEPSAHGFEWLDLCDDPAQVDVVMTSCKVDRRVLRSAHPRRIVYLQETTEEYRPPAFDLLREFDLVLSNDQRVLDALPDRTRYMTLFGIRMPPDHYAVVPEKTRNISLMGSPRVHLIGHLLRWRTHDRLTGFDAFGFDGRPYWKSESLGPYRFQICIENTWYPHWATEKLWDAFALETVPIYWGGISDEMLTAWGFRADGLIRWSGRLEELRDRLEAINAAPEEHYAARAEAVAQNRRRVLELPCGEVALRSVIADFFRFAV